VPVTTELNGADHPRRSIELLWGIGVRPRRGPRPKLTVALITAAAIELADAEGLPAVSMRRVAERLGVGGMSLYTYLPGKAELLDLMVDAVYGEVGRPCCDEGDWRGSLEAVARQNWAMYLRHPWLLQAAVNRPVLGPHTMTKYEHELRAVARSGLTPIEMDLVIGIVTNYVHGAVRNVVELPPAESRTGMTDQQWWAAYGPLLAEVIDPERFPTAAAVGTASADGGGGPFDPARSFELGLRLILDGLGAMIATRHRTD
jgi:AcrR family transcriptional regulator